MSQSKKGKIYPKSSRLRNSTVYGHSTDKSRIVRKPAVCKCENKDADQLRGNRETDQRLCFHYIDSHSLFILNPKFKASSHLLWRYSPVCVALVGNPEDRFSHNEAYKIHGIYIEYSHTMCSLIIFYADEKSILIGTPFLPVILYFLKS